MKFVTDCYAKQICQCNDCNVSSLIIICNFFKTLNFKLFNRMNSFSASEFSGSENKFKLECCVPGCNFKASKGFHNFPKDIKRRSAWVRKTKTFHLNERAMDSYAKKCLKHFRDMDYDYIGNKKRLKRSAMPSVCLPDSLTFSDENINLK